MSSPPPPTCDEICQYLIICGGHAAASAGALVEISKRGLMTPDKTKEALILCMKFKEAVESLVLNGKTDKQLGLPPI